MANNLESNNEDWFQKAYNEYAAAKRPWFLQTVETPEFLKSANTSNLESFQKQIPGLFDTSGLDNAYSNSMNSMMAQGRGMAASSANAYANKAMQVGASGLGATFAQSQAMLPFYKQRSEMMADLEGQKLRNRQMQADTGFKTASEIENQKSRYQGTMSDFTLGNRRVASDYFGNTQKLLNDYLTRKSGEKIDQQRLDLERDRNNWQKQQANNQYLIEASRQNLANTQFLQNHWDQSQRDWNNQIGQLSLREPYTGYDTYSF